MFIDAWYPFVGGGQVHVKNLIAGLEADHGCRVRLFYPIHSNILIRAIWSLIVPWQVWMLNFRQHYDILHSHGYNSGLAAKLAGILIRRPVVHTVHGSPLLDQQVNSLRGRLERILLTKIHYDAQISVARVFLRHPNVNQHIHIIPNGVDVTAFDQNQTPKAKQPTVIWVGRTDPVKNLSQLKQAFDLVKAKIPDAELEIISNGRITGAGLVSQYKQAWVFALPSKAEGQPITLLEAWAAKLPVVVTPVGDNPDMVKEGINGYLVKVGDSRLLADKLIFLLTRPNLGKTMGENGYNYVRQNHPWKAIVKANLDIYKNLVK
jgi:glycosyltransferase involved in cell wall biosynthesis